MLELEKMRRQKARYKMLQREVNLAKPAADKRTSLGALRGGLF